MIPKTYKSCCSDVCTSDVPVNVEEVRTIDEEEVIKENKEEEEEVVESEEEEEEEEEEEQEKKVLVSETMFVCVDDIAAGTLCGQQTKTLKVHAFTMIPNQIRICEVGSSRIFETFHRLNKTYTRTTNKGNLGAGSN